MELTILGSGTAAPSRRRAAPGFLLAIGKDLILLDAGPGTMGRVLKAGNTPDEVTHIICSHNHLDHSSDVAPWLFAARVPSCARTAPLTLAGSAGFHQMMDGLGALYGHWLEAKTYRRDPLTLIAGAEAVSFDGWSLQAGAVDHIESSLAIRVTDEHARSLVYTGDTAPCDAVVDFARGADLLLIEASTPDDNRLPGHMTPSDAGEIAIRAGVKRVILTHMNPVCDGVDMLGQLARRFPGEALLAEDSMRVIL